MSAKELDPEFDLNIASIIDCFTVLITYLLLTASFITLGIFDVTVVASSPESKKEASADNKLNITVGVHKNNDIKIEVEGGGGGQLIPNREGAQDIATLATSLEKIKAKNDAVTASMVTAEDETEYRALVKVIETVRKIFPQIAISAEN